MPSSLLKISDLSQDDLHQILDLAAQFKLGLPFDRKSNITSANLFFENSTRTRVSFELAARRLGCSFINIDVASSSTSKGETFIDTLSTLVAMEIDAFIIRLTEEVYLSQAQAVFPNISFINAGEGMLAHPSQALLDLFTIQTQFKQFENLKITICGDIKHSRVASSLIYGLTLAGVKDIVLVAPKYFLPSKSIANTIVEENLDKAIKGTDVVYVLRVQKERIQSTLPIEDYIKMYSLTTQMLATNQIKPKIMHPGPINRGIEISSELADSSNSLILDQVNNGVYMRMAIIMWCLLN